MKILLLFIVVQICLQEKYDTDPYGLINYRELIGLSFKVQESDSFERIIKYVDLFEKYSVFRPKCPVDFNGECQNIMYELTNFEKGEEFIYSRPVVLLMGGMHGNEVTGTNSLYNLVQIFMKYGLTNAYLKNILDKVRLLIIPAINIQGFSETIREENIHEEEIDPNRDFPYNQEKKGKCLLTTTSMLLDKIFRDYTIISAITFHGGDNSITYPWGAFAHESDPITGDNAAFSEMAKLLQRFAGSNDKLDINEYQIGTMQDIVYDVNGGFEDWAYGASWDKKNLPKTCNKNEFIKDDIKYDDENNRCFVFLVEAGEDKIPDSETLGNEISVFKPFDKNAIWGNISRNIHMSLKFAEYANPTLNIDKVTFDKGIFIKLRILGCVKVSEIKIDNLNHLIRSKKYEPETGHHIVHLVITQVEEYMDEIIIQGQCDFHWKKDENDKIPQTHLVRLRTDENYNVVNQKGVIKSQKNFKAILINIQTGFIKNSYLLKQDHDIFTFVYSTDYKIDLLGGAITLFHEDGNLNFQVFQGEEEYQLTIQQYGSESCCSTESSGKSILKISTSEQLPINSDNFYGLLGKTVNIYSNVVEKNIFYSQITLKNNDSFSTLVIPYNGVTQYSENTENYFYINAYVFAEKKIKIELLSTFNTKLILKTIGKEIELYHSEPFLISGLVYSHFSIIDLESYNEYRWLGAEFEIVDENGVVLYQDIWASRNPNFFEEDQITQNFGEFRKQTKNVNLVNPIIEQDADNKFEYKGVIIFLVLLCLFIVLLKKIMDKRQKISEQEYQENIQVN